MFYLKCASSKALSAVKGYPRRRYKNLISLGHCYYLGAAKFQSNFYDRTDKAIRYPQFYDEAKHISMQDVIMVLRLSKSQMSTQ